ncbi:hypothetical protein K458DRAFT_420689 [Lentithecium fluviatile CBS 122367]|uniref:Uncharacterized protein n=1 Tax=Lentithecium fluviatile CBS 122367 TaxID=1168545 RepID=A0A6G1ITF4_9PLEO|nr:hypothetical protein K458DRAFT_420689 [Lentithecium fluviatile CBS 122367]
MASKAQSPGPATTSQSKQARSRKAASSAEQSTVGRTGSTGGILLEKEQAAKAKSSLATAKNATTAPARDQDAATAGPTRPRRKPRKLNREPASAQTTSATSTSVAAADVPPPQTSTTELEALKSRVRGLEAKVEELYLVAESRGGRSPRRRGKGRKGSSSTQVPTISTTAAPAPADDEEEADEELVRLEDELEVARRDLESFRPRTRPRTKRSTSGDTEYVEEILRDDIGGTGDGTVDRQVTLSGSYRIPLPASVSMDDVKNIQSGVSAAQNVAKSFLEQRRVAQAARAPTPPTTSTARPKATKKPSVSASMEVSKEDGGKSWGEWFGGYSMAISRAVKNIEAEAAVESQKAGAGAGRPSVKGSMERRPVGGKKPAAGASAGAKRPKARQGNLSSEQVQGLMG